MATLRLIGEEISVLAESLVNDLREVNDGGHGRNPGPRKWRTQEVLVSVQVSIALATGSQLCKTPVNLLTTRNRMLPSSSRAIWSLNLNFSVKISRAFAEKPVM